MPRGERLLWVPPLCFLVEVIVAGPAGLRFLPIRYGLFVALVFSLAAMALGRKATSRRAFWPVLAICGFLLLNLLWATVVPAVQGTELPHSLNEAKAYLLLVPAALFVVVARGEGLYLRRLQRVVLVTTGVVAAVQVLVWIIGTVIPETRTGFVVGVAVLFRQAESVYVGTMPDGFFRVFWISSLWSLLALFWLGSGVLSRHVTRLLAAVYGLSIFVSYSRGLWLAVAVGFAGVGATYLLCGRWRRVSLPSLAVASGTVGAALGIAATTGHVDSVLARLGSAVDRGDVSVEERLAQAPHLLDLWADHPVLGGGFGAYAPTYIRLDETPYSYENMPYALLAKLGLVGVALTAAFFVMVWGSAALAGRAGGRTREAAHLSGAITCVFVASVTNPLLLNFVGMSIVSCLLVHWAHFVQGDAGEPRRLL